MEINEPTEEQRKDIAVSSYLIETGQVHAKNVLTGECIPEICVKCKLEKGKKLGQAIGEEQEQLKDITGAEEVEIKIRKDGNVIWVNTEKGCILRICKIKHLSLEDERPPHKLEV